MSFFNTRCIDGRLRNGTVYMDYKYDPLNNPNANPNSEYYHEFGFAGKISLLNYRIDGWIVTQFNDAVPGYVYNLLETNQYDPKVITLKWKIAGKYKFIHPTDSTKNIVWDGSIIKTLTNTNDPKVFSKAKNPVITWSLATVSYSGQVTGMTNSVVPYTMKIEQTNQVVRTFTCYPDKIAGVSITPQGTLSTRYEEHHPFVSGIASFTTSNKYPRQIYFGNEGNADLSTQCDNTGEILIKGISYRVNFIK
jgi:hypothetical protein